MCKNLVPIAIDEQTLTAKEMDVLNLLAHGHTYNEVADQLYISVSTVRKHTGSILKKLNAKNTAHATALAIKKHLIQ